jgi:hypothetical protein
MIIMVWLGGRHRTRASELKLKRQRTQNYVVQTGGEGGKGDVI